MQNLLKKYTCLVLMALICFLSPGFSADAAPRAQQFRDNDHPVIVIDPGHGGENEGTIENGFLEKSMTMVTAQAMYDELRKYDNVDVYLTRAEDVDLSLKERAEFAASVNADFLFSIHYNASVDHDLFGSEVWISSKNPYNAYGYQFGYIQMEAMQDMGLFLRGIKTRLNDRGSDYYGIIRESVALDIPAVIIEHCHVDEERDSSFCDSEEELIAFGKADAEAVARYLGLTEETPSFPEVKENEPVAVSLKDETPPEDCTITVLSRNEEIGEITLEVQAKDSDSPLIYYRYSYDGGYHYSPLIPWPDSDVLSNSYAEQFTFTLQVPSGIRPRISVLAYNLFDAFTESNQIIEDHVYRYGEEPEDADPEDADPEYKEPSETSEILVPAASTNTETAETQELIIIVLLIVVLILLALIIFRLAWQIIQEK